MKFRRITIVLLSLLAIAFSTPALAAASTSATVFKFHGVSALADFDSYSPDGCIETFVGVFGSQGTSGPQASVFIGQFDNCTSTLLLSAAGSTSNPTLHVAGNLTSASLSATITVFDYVSSNTFDVSVNTTWTASGALTREVGVSHFKTANFSETFHFNDTFRDASAVGTVSDGTTNFAPSLAEFAQIASFKSGEVDITHQ